MIDENKPLEGKGSRQPKKIKPDYTTLDSYSYYKKNVPEKLHVESKKVYMEVIKLFLHKFMSKIVYHSEELSLPLNLGKLSVIKVPFNPEKELNRIDNPNLLNTFIVDWKASKQYGKKIPFVNEHSNYNRYKYNWNKRSSIMVNKTLYSLRMMRYWKRELARAIKEDKKDYFTL